MLRIYSRRGTHGNVVCQFGDGIDEALKEAKNADANAQFIVTAVNTHYDLVTACELMLNLALSLPKTAARDKEIEFARLALSKAAGEKGKG